MKTLEQVIHEITQKSGLEIRNVKKPENDRFWVDRETYNDALCYLRMYKELADDSESYAKWKENPQLTWGDLKKMDEQPIWVEVYNGERAWFLVFVDPDDDEKIFGIDAYGAKRQFNKNLWTNGTVKGYRNGRQ